MHNSFTILISSTAVFN